MGNCIELVSGGSSTISLIWSEGTAIIRAVVYSSTATIRHRPPHIPISLANLLLVFVLRTAPWTSAGTFEPVEDASVGEASANWLWKIEVYLVHFFHDVVKKVAEVTEPSLLSILPIISATSIPSRRAWLLVPLAPAERLRIEKLWS